MTILHHIRAHHAVSREHEISPTVLVARAVEQGARRPTDAVLRSPARYSAWETAARQLVFAPIGITPADHDELVDACDRLAGGPMITVRSVLNRLDTALGVTAIAALAHLFVWTSWS